MEDKNMICNLLLLVFQETDELGDLLDLFYDNDTNNVFAKFKNGSSKIINISSDSGVTMIKDIVKAIC